MSAYDVPTPLIPDYIAQHGRWSARKPALLCGPRALDWSGFDAATCQVANGLAALGLVPGARVAVLMGNGIEMALALFGAIRAGVSVVPLNLSVADAAVAGMIADSGARAVLTTPDQQPRVDALLAAGRLPASLLRIGVDARGEGWIDFESWRTAQAATPPRARVLPTTECNIIYSSGTTGLPKGIVHDQQCRANWATDLAIALHYRSDAVTLLSLGLYSNISWVAMLNTVLVGGTMVVMPAFSAEAVLEEIAQRGATHAVFVPVQLQRLLASPALAARRPRTLRSIMCCGSPLAPALKRAVPEALGCELIELYGLTEGIVTTLAPEDFLRKLDSVGRPIPGQQLRIVGDDDRELPWGQPGEIVGHGRLVMEGYHGRPEATAEATWTDADGRRWLRTGDIGRLDEEGFLYLVDRKKDMIISGGQNIYPADIEAVLLGHPDVAEIAVIGVPSERWGESPVAIVVPRAAQAGGGDAASRSPAAGEALREWANARLGRQQRIAAVHFRDSLPRNPNGKILKRELRKEYPPVP
ncbi:MAG: class I adenylate-forming enzyme family protein [Steroidobacteraceae bacterium]